MRTVFRPNQLAVALVIAASVAPGAVRAQAQQSARAPVVDVLLLDIRILEDKLTGLVEAMPAEAYAWRPGEGVRSTGEVVMHIAADNYFLPTPAGVPAPEATGIQADDYATVQAYETRAVTKAEAMAAMKESFAHLRAALEQTDDALLARKLSVFGNQMTGLELWLVTSTHLHEHLGQLIAYARSNGVVPPWSG